MKSILLSIKPEWLCKILNGEKTIEVRKKFPKDYVGWVYLYCSKGNKKNWHLIEVVDNAYSKTEYEYDYYIGSEGYLDWCLEGKVVARFWCDKVEELIYGEEVGYPRTKTLDSYDITEKSAIWNCDIKKYLKGKNGYAIHISKLEIFDRPKELGKFYKVGFKSAIEQAVYIQNKSMRMYKIDLIEDEYQLTKAPQSFMYVDID